MINATTAFRILKSVEQVLEKIFGPRATAVILRILHPFKHPGLGVMFFKWHHIMSFLTNQKVQFLCSPLEIVFFYFVFSQTFMSVYNSIEPQRTCFFISFRKHHDEKND